MTTPGQFAELAHCLHNKGIGSYLQNPDLLVVSNEYPAMPSSNCYWVRKWNDAWHIGTWLPAAYLVPNEQDICLICQTIFRSAPTAIYTVDTDLAAQLGLRRLTEEEITQMGFD